MKLNPDCIRDILLTAEEHCTFDKFMIYNRESSCFEQFKKYSHDEIVYHINQCKYAELLIDVSFQYDGDIITIGDLSPEGHEFLANIRNDTNWNNIKSIGLKVGSTSLQALTQIASAVITEIIKSQLGLI